VGLPTQLPPSWTARRIVGSTPRRLPTPSTSSPPTADLIRRWKDLQDTPPPALLPPVRLQFHGSALDTPKLAEEVANRGTMEEDKGEGLVGAEHAEGGQAAKEAEEEMAEGGHEPEGAFEEEMAGGGEEAEEALEEDRQGGAGFLPTPVENHYLTQRVTKTARRRRLLSESKAQLRDELAQLRRQGLRSACKSRRGEEEEGSQEGRG
jgi:hypothetical protein